jgi:hypothetical protein
MSKYSIEVNILDMNCDRIILKISFLIGAIVPIYQSFKWGNFKVSVTPNGVRRLLPFLPYLTGSDLDITVKIETIDKKPSTFSYESDFNYYVDNKCTTIKLESDNIALPQKKFITGMKIPRLSDKGHHKIIFGIAYPMLSEPYKIRIVDFYTIDQDELMMQFLFMAFGFIIGYIVKWIFG